MLLKNRFFSFVVMHFAFLLYALYSVIGKLGATSEFLSGRFIILYGIVFFLLFIYAILWQQVLKVIPLSTAIANKAIIIVWGILLGTILFHENITPRMIIGAVVILTGILILSTEQEDD